MSRFLMAEGSIVPRTQRVRDFTLSFCNQACYVSPAGWHVFRLNSGESSILSKLIIFLGRIPEGSCKLLHKADA